MSEYHIHTETLEAVEKHLRAGGTIESMGHSITVEYGIRQYDRVQSWLKGLALDAIDDEISSRGSS